MIKKIIGLMCVTTVALGATQKLDADNSNVPPHNVPVPEITQDQFLSYKQIEEMAATSFAAEKKRKPSGSGPTVASKDLMSEEYKKFVEKIIECKTGDKFYEVLQAYDKRYESIPASETDLKFAVARMSTWLPLRGVVWKMTPMVHSVLVTQQVLVGTLRNMAEQAMINFPDSHVEAQMLFLTLPAINTDDRGQKTFEERFKHESRFIKFLAEDIYQSLSKAVDRIEKIERMANVSSKGVAAPIVFDSRIRFGEQAFPGKDYSDPDRLKVVGEAEKFATLARLNRRLAAISSMVAYNWNGHLAARKKIGQQFGIGATEAFFFDLANTEGKEYVDAPTRRERREILVNDFPKLYKIVPNGDAWMKRSYFFLHRSAHYLEKTWRHIETDKPENFMQLDPEVFQARREQVEEGVSNLMKLAGTCNEIEVNKKKTGICDTKDNGFAELRGSLSRKPINVNLKAFYENPPKDLKLLLPLADGFSGNKDLDSLKASGVYKSMVSLGGKRPDVIRIKLPNGDETTFRNYLYDRAILWNNGPEAYGTVFPGVSKKGVGDAMAIINETRGVRVMNNAFSMFIR